MTLYTVVVCPECQYARVVPRTPKRTSCGRCQTSKQFDKLRHYYRTENKEAAADVRSEVQARVNHLDAEFDEAYEEGHITAEVSDLISDDEYLRKKGADAEAIEAAGERAEQSNQRTRSKREIMRDAINENGETRDSVLKYATEHGIDEDWADSYLNRALSNGGVTGGRDGPFRLL